MAKKATNYLSSKWNTTVSVEKVDITLFKFFTLEHVFLADQKSDTLISIDEINFVLHSIRLTDSLNRIHLGDVELQNPIYRLHQNKGDDFTNLSFLIKAFGSSDTTSSRPIVIDIGKIIVEGGQFMWNNENYDSIPFGMDWNHLSLNDIQLELADFQMMGDSFSGEFQIFSFNEASGFVLDNLSANAIFTPEISALNQLTLVTSQTHIRGDIVFDYDSIANYANFIEDVNMNLNFDSSVVSLRDVSYFATALEGLDDILIISGKERGPVSDLKLTNLDIRYGEHTEIAGRVFISGLPDLENTAFNCKFKKLSTHYFDLSKIKMAPFTGDKTLELPDFLLNAGTINFKGDFNGFYDDFVTFGTFNSNTGKIETDLQLAPDEKGEIVYNGRIKTTNFNVGHILKNDLFNQASIDIEVHGRNLDFKTMQLTAKGKASIFDFKGYRYSDITLDGKVENQVISGLFEIADTNICFLFNGSIGLNEDLPNYKFEAEIEHLRPTQLHLMERDSSASLSTNLVFNFKGNSLDNVIGRIGLTDFHYEENGEEINQKSIDFVALTTGIDKTIALQSEDINLQITGEYYFDDAFQFLKYLTYTWLPSAFNEPQKKPTSVEKIQLDLDVQNFSSISTIFFPQVGVENEFHLSMNLDSEEDRLTVKGQSSHMQVAGYEAENMVLQAEITSDTFWVDTDFSRVYISEERHIENFEIQALASNNIISSAISWHNDSPEIQNNGNIEFDISFIDPNNFDVVFYNSEFKINDSLWNIADSGRIIRQNIDFAFSNVAVSQGNQKFSIEGFISEDPTKELVVDVDSLNLEMLNPFLKENNLTISGIVDGTSLVKNVYENVSLLSDLNFQNLVFNSQKIGDGKFISNWIDSDKRFDIDVHFVHDKRSPIVIKGNYYPSRETDQLNLKVNLEQVELAILEPFMNGILSDIKGGVSGEASLKGKFSEILIDGDFVISNASTKIDFLNETMFFDNQHVFIRPNLIGADAIDIFDSKGKRASLNFSLFHENFSKMNFDLSVTSYDIFRAFNTTSKDSDYFYGQIFLSPGSTVGMDSDYEGNLNVVANVTSGPGTSVFIPLFDENEVSKIDYIHFVQSEKDTLSQDSNTLQKDALKLAMNVSMDLNRDADITLLMDEFSSDKIQAKGSGAITVQMNENQNFKMYGNYEIDEGFYLFTFSKILSKKFNIKPKSLLTWNGDPYEGIANITASYKVRTSLYELGPVISAAYDTTELKRRIPVEVLLRMTENYMNPVLSFSFELPPKYAEIEQLLNGLDESERNKQVFGLLILNKFMPISGGAVSGNSVVATNSTEVISNQLSNWLSKISNDVDIGVRYQPGDQITGNQMEVALSTQLFNNRVYVETNFGVSSTTQSTSNAKNNNFVGEFTISYKINEKGNVIAKVFNRSNELNPVYQNVSPYTQGIGLAYSEPFHNWNNLGCLLGNHFRNKDNKKDCAQEYYNNSIENSQENIARIKRSIERRNRKDEKRQKGKVPSESTIGTKDD